MPDRWRCAALILLGAPGCQQDGGAPADPCTPPRRMVGEQCIEPGIADNGCPAGTLGLDDGSCRPAGLSPEMCAEGFAHDGDRGCEPILPPEPCPRAWMAVPGESSCRPVMPCGRGKWGDIPVEPNTEYVDAAYPGMDSDGSAQKPWTTVAAAYAAAAPGALVAIAEGSYPAPPAIAGKSVRFHGVCPDKVELVGTTAPALRIALGANGTEVRGLALTGGSAGLLLDGSTDVIVDRVWVHDTSSRGINIQSVAAPSSARVVGALIEYSRSNGVYVSGAQASVEASVVRDTQPDDAGLVGRGILIQYSADSDAASSATVRGALIERNHDFGVLVAGSEASIEASVVRDTRSQASDGGRGKGIQIQSNLTTTAPSIATVRGSVVERNRTAAIVVAGSHTSLEALVVRDTAPQESDGRHGSGIVFEPEISTGAPALASARACLVERSHALGVLVLGSEVDLESIAVRDIFPQAADAIDGRGIVIQADLGFMTASAATVRGSLVERSHEIGVLVWGADATLEAIAVRDTSAQANDGLFGDGVVVIGALPLPARATVSSSHIANSARAGLSNFGAFSSLATTRIECASFDMKVSQSARTASSSTTRVATPAVAPWRTVHAQR